MVSGRREGLKIWKCGVWGSILASFSLLSSDDHFFEYAGGAVEDARVQREIVLVQADLVADKRSQSKKWHLAFLSFWLLQGFRI